MKRISLKEVGRNVLLALMSMIGLALFIFIVGDASPEVEESASAMQLYWAVKFTSLLAVVGLCHIGGTVRKYGLLPKWFERELEEVDGEKL